MQKEIKDYTQEQIAEVLIKLKDMNFDKLKNGDALMNKISRLKTIEEKIEAFELFIFLYNYKDWSRFDGVGEIFIRKTMKEIKKSENSEELYSHLREVDRKLMSVVQTLTPKIAKEMINKYSAKQKQ